MDNAADTEIIEMSERIEPIPMPGLVEKMQSIILIILQPTFQRDPEETEIFEENAENYKQQIEELSAEIEEGTA